MKPLAPKRSKEYLALLESAPDVVTRLALRRFLWQINAHWELISLPIVCQNVREMLDLAVNVWRFDLEKLGLSDWQEAIDWIHKNEIQLAEAIGGDFGAQFSGQGNHPLMGDGVIRHSVYATLCNSHINPTNNSYRLLQAHLLFAKIAVMREYTSLDQYESYARIPALLEKKAYPYNAALAIRSMSEGRSPNLLEAFSVGLPPLEFLRALHDVIPAAPKDIGRYSNLVVFLRKAFGSAEQAQRPWHPRSGASAERSRVHGGSTDWSPIQREENPFEDPSDNSSHRRGYHSTTTRCRYGALEAKERLDVDDCPDEDEEDEDVDRTGFDDAAFQRAPGSFHEVSATQAMHVQMVNQLFPWAYGELNVSEITPLMERYLRLRATSETQELVSEPMAADKLEVLALVQVMLWTSSSLERAQSLRVLDSTTSGRFADLSLRFKTEDGIARWRIRAPLPHYRRPQSPVPEDMNRIQFEFIELPDVADGSFLIRELLKSRKDKADVTSQQPSSSRAATRVFTHTPSWYRKQFRSLLPPGTRVTESRLSKFLLTRILMESGGDVTAAAIITGTAPQIAKVKLFYACPLVSRLQRIYVNVATGLKNELWQTIKQTPPVPIHVQLDSRPIYIGSRLCPTLNAVQKAVAKIKRELKDTSPTLELQHYHNLFTLYTMLMFFYTTGVRGIRTPYIDLSDIELESGLSTLTDKDSGVGYKSRLVRFTPTLIEQMKCYEDFISRSPYVYRMLDSPCFLLGPDLHPIEVRPRTLAPLLKDILPFPVNIHRRFISSELLDTGCPPEVVSAWMGHWHRGEEPWGRFSSFSHGEFCRTLEHFLDPLLAKLGLCAPACDALVVPKL